VEYEQFFDLRNDPWEKTNLVMDAKSTRELQKFRLALDEWEKNTEKTDPVKSNGVVEE
jgi:arylsulfatase A-like enzyme